MHNRNMDLVNSVTQNSNNRNVTMENQGQGEGDSNRDNNNYNHASSSNDSPGVFLHADANESKNQVPDYLKAIGMDPRKFWPKKYRFTREKAPGQYNPLTIAQRNFYEANGYIVIDELVSQKLINAIRTQYKQSAFVDEFLIDKLVAKNTRLLQYLKCFCDDRLMLMTHQLVESFQTNDIVKAMMDNESSQRQQLYRDWIFLPFRPIDKVVCTVSAIEAIEHVLLVVPGTHRVGQCNISSTLENITAAYESSQEKDSRISINREIFECSPERLSSLVEKSKRGFKYINLKPGQVLFYHPGLVHGFSDDLINFRKRQIASLAYYAAADCEFVDFRSSLEALSAHARVPIGLAHFKDKNPSDYSSWINKPRLLNDTKAGM